MSKIEIRNYLFHRVSNVYSNWAPSLSEKMFEKCIRYISRNHTVFTVEDLLLNNEFKDNEKKIACISFDDGFKDNIEIAAPILQKYNIKASFYITTDSIDKGIPTWTHILPFLFETTNKTKLRLQSDTLPESLKEQSFGSASDRILFGKALYNAIFHIPFEETRKIMEQVGDQFDDTQLPENLMMNWNDILHLINQGHRIGSHTSSHPILTRFQDKRNLKSELIDSKEKIESKCNISVNSISYPNGAYNEEIKRLARDCGYTLGLAVNQKFCYSDELDYFEIPRVDIYADSNNWIKTYLRLTGHIETVKNILR
jgi:peptidoglycan/xylan/chitin deacetylase (PgdA/CDA1 family)